MDEKYDEAVALVSDLGQASISLVQRYLKVGYNRAARSSSTWRPKESLDPRRRQAPQSPRQEAMKKGLAPYSF